MSKFPPAFHDLEILLLHYQSDDPLLRVRACDAIKRCTAELEAELSVSRMDGWELVFQKLTSFDHHVSALFGLAETISREPHLALAHADLAMIRQNIGPFLQ